MLGMEKDFASIKKIKNGYTVSLDYSKGDDYESETVFATTLEEAYAFITEYFAARAA